MQWWERTIAPPSINQRYIWIWVQYGKICLERHHKKWKEERLWICYNQYRVQSNKEINFV